MSKRKDPKVGTGKKPKGSGRRLYTDENPKDTVSSLKDWTKQKWRTKSGKKSSETGERYLPEKAIKALSPQEYAASTRKKRADTKKGKQFSKQPKRIAKKTRQYRKTS